MKATIVKAVALCTLALSLLFMGVAAVDAVDTGVASATVAFIPHDGPYDEGIEY